MGSAPRRALAILARRLPAALVAVCLVGVMGALALVGLDALAGASSLMKGMIGATKLLVFVDPRAAQTDAEALGARLSAIPGVAGARFRNKRSALKDLEGAHPALATAHDEISFPDAWVVTLKAPNRVGAETRATTSLVQSTEGIRAAAAAMPGVGSIHVDRGWIAGLDRWDAALRTLDTPVAASMVLSLAVAAFGIFFLAGTALRLSLHAQPLLGQELSMGVAAYVSLSLGLVATGLAFALHALAGWGLRGSPANATGVLEPWFTHFSRSGSDYAWAVAAAIIAASFIGVAGTARSRHLPLSARVR